MDTIDIERLRRQLGA